ncbi:MAG: polysaccharide deacetylase family protein [Chloroflexota bacterium]
MKQGPSGAFVLVIALGALALALLVSCSSLPSVAAVFGTSSGATAIAVAATPAPEVLSAQPTPPTSTPTVTPSPTATPRPTATPTSTPTPRPPVVPGVRSAPSGTLVVSGRNDKGVVALTMDAGLTSPGGTSAVLDTLRRRGWRATVFLTGEWAAANPDLVRRIVAEGHEVANHTYDHPRMPTLSEAENLAQLARTEATVRAIAGVELKKYVRPPFGDYDDRVLNTLGTHGYRLIFWSMDSGDWRPEVTAADMVARVGARATAGDVVVGHIYAPKTAEALPGILDAWAARGLRAGTLSEVLAP